MILRLAGCCALAGAGIVAGAVAIFGIPAFTIASPIAPALTLVYGCIDLARPFLFALGVIAIAVALWTYRRGKPYDGAKLALFVVLMAGVLLARSVAAFLFCWELMALVSLFLVGTHHRMASVRRALFSYGSVSQIGTVAIAIALVLLGSGASSFRFDDIAHAGALLAPPMCAIVAGLALVGFGSKAGLVPLHFWLPRAHPAAPANASALLSGVMLNVAIYGLLLVTSTLVPVAPALGAVVAGAGAISAVAGALLAALESDVKRLLAYSSIENVGIVVAALGVYLIAHAYQLPAVAGLALLAALLHAINHGFFKSALFLSAGTVAQNAGTSDLEHLGALSRLLPFTSIGALIASAAAAALPPTNAFASEWLAFRAFAVAVQSRVPLLSIVAIVEIAALALAGGLAAIAAIKLVAGGFLGAPRSTHPVARERLDAASVSVLLLAAIAIVTGLVPALLLVPLQRVVATLGGPPAIDAGNLPVLPFAIALLPIAGAIATVAYARSRRVQRVATWSCGSPQGSRAGYTPTALTNPIRRISGEPIAEAVERDLARGAAAVIQRASRRLRLVQGGLLRVYLVYAAAAVIVVLVIAR